MAWVYLSVTESPTWYWSLVSLPSSSQQAKSPSCSSTEELVSRCLMVSPPHLPTAHLIVRTVLALVCFSVSISLLFYTIHLPPPPLPFTSLIPSISCFSVDHNRENSSSPALPPSHCLSLSRCSSHPALIRSQSLKIKGIKHRYQVLVCKLAWCKGETISLLYFINLISLSLLLAPLLPAPGKSMLIVMMFCPPPASVHSLPPPATHQPLASIACFLCISRRPQK